MKKIKILFFISGVFLLHVPARSSEADSLRNIWMNQSLADTVRLEAVETWAWNTYLFVKPDSAFILAQQEYDFAKQIGDSIYMAGALKLQGASLYLRGIYSKAMECYTEAMKIYADVKDQRGVAACLINIGNIYSEQKEYDHAIEYYSKGYKIETDINNKTEAAKFLNNIGVNYKAKGDFPSAMEYYKLALTTYRELNINDGIANALNNIGNLLQLMGREDAAYERYSESLNIFEKLNDQQGQAMVLNNLSEHYFRSGNNDKAIDYAERALVLATKTGKKTVMRDAQYSLFQAYKKEGKSENALKAYEVFISIRDSIQDNESKKMVLQQELQYKYEKQYALDQKEHEKEKAIADEQEKKQRYIIYAAIFVLLITGVFLFIIFNRWKLTKKQNVIIADQKKLVEVKQKEVMDSIKYAQRIQHSLLPTEKYISKNITRLNK